MPSHFSRQHGEMADRVHLRALRAGLAAHRLLAVEGVHGAGDADGRPVLVDAAACRTATAAWCWSAGATARRTSPWDRRDRARSASRSRGRACWPCRARRRRAKAKRPIARERAQGSASSAHEASNARANAVRFMRTSRSRLGPNCAPSGPAFPAKARPQALERPSVLKPPGRFWPAIPTIQDGLNLPRRRRNQRAWGVQDARPFQWEDHHDRQHRPRQHAGTRRHRVHAGAAAASTPYDGRWSLSSRPNAAPATPTISRSRSITATSRFQD